MTIDQSVLSAILAVIGGGVVTAIVQAVKKWLKIEGGWQAMLLAAGPGVQLEMFDGRRTEVRP